MVFNRTLSIGPIGCHSSIPAVLDEFEFDDLAEAATRDRLKWASRASATGGDRERADILRKRNQ